VKAKGASRKYSELGASSNKFIPGTITPRFVSSPSLNKSLQMESI
jgi:hypothetical protein